MSSTIRTNFGCTEAIIDDDCGLKRFYEVAEILSEDLSILFTAKKNEIDTLTWNFAFRDQQLTLHYNIYTGISLYPFMFGLAVNQDNEAVIELANFLEQKLMVHTTRRYYS